MTDGHHLSGGMSERAPIIWAGPGTRTGTCGVALLICTGEEMPLTVHCQPGESQSRGCQEGARQEAVAKGQIPYREEGKGWQEWWEEGAGPEQSSDSGSLASGGISQAEKRCGTAEMVQVGCRPGRLPGGGVGSTGAELSELEPCAKEINV